LRAYVAIDDMGVRALLAGLGFGMLAHQVFGLTDAFILGTKPGVLMWIYLALAAVMYMRRAKWKVDGRREHAASPVQLEP
jgi:TRAP-type C4-dicarboxylate transport system permease large subunit